MGCQATKREYFVSLRLDEYVPEDHLLRAEDHLKKLSTGAIPSKPAARSGSIWKHWNKPIRFPVAPINCCLLLGEELQDQRRLKTAASRFFR